jgi:mannose-6-phosphate isomerase
MASKPQTVSADSAGVPQRLVPVASAKPWGRRIAGLSGLGTLAVDAGAVIGEIHHRLVDAGDPELLVKTLFTGERLSVQVHPDAAAARQAGFPRGKDEAWVVLAAEPGACIGLGLKAATDAATLRAAALDGSIVDMMFWHPCQAGDVLFSPAGTIHAIGAGVTLFEIQQNLDLTYRLHDYGRGRELHLDAAMAVVDLGAWSPPPALPSPGPGRELLVEGPGFVFERVRLDGRATVVPPPGRPAWLAIVGGTAQLAGAPVAAGEVWYAEAPCALLGDGEILIAYPGDTALPHLWQGA